MHELSLVRQLFAVLEEEIGKHGMTRVTRVVLRIGALSCAVPALMTSAFVAYSKGTFAEGAALEINLDPAMGRCDACGATFPVKDFLLVCPECGSRAGMIEAGRDVTVQRVELEG